MTKMNFEANNMKPHHGTEKSRVLFVAVKNPEAKFFLDHLNLSGILASKTSYCDKIGCFLFQVFNAV